MKNIMSVILFSSGILISMLIFKYLGEEYTQKNIMKIVLSLKFIAILFLSNICLFSGFILRPKSK